MTTYQHPNAGV